MLVALGGKLWWFSGSVLVIGPKVRGFKPG
jgi:hypothetical protein